MEFLWAPSKNRIQNTHMHAFMDHFGFESYDALWQFSIQNPEKFWAHVWRDTNILGHLDENSILNDAFDIQNATFFEHSTLNFAENLLKRRDDAVAIYACDENGGEIAITCGELYIYVVRTAKYLTSLGVRPGDRVAGYMPNTHETVIASLATAAIGGVWSGCSPDFGVQGVLDRFAQITPKVLITNTHYPYNGKTINILEKIPEILSGLPSVTHVLVGTYGSKFDDHTNGHNFDGDNFKNHPPMDDPNAEGENSGANAESEESGVHGGATNANIRSGTGSDTGSGICANGHNGGTNANSSTGTNTNTNTNYVDFSKLYTDATIDADDFEFAQFPFNHPLYIIYSSGTTGVPKCIIHGAGGTLIEHKKEHRYHCDISENDVVFYYTTCGWMMWHWLVSALSANASIILFEGSPLYPKDTVLFDIAERLNVTFFGTSAKYLSALQKNDCDIINTFPLQHLRTIASTGSPLLPATYRYIYASIKSDVHVASISGGTDILGCFLLGAPVLNVHAGELQCITLGYHVDVADDEGHPLPSGKGELVCRNAFPSRPLGFWSDYGGKKYHDAYYTRFKNTWHHGDFIERTSNGGYIIHGRSDAVLNPGGVRIGTAEIYRQVEKIPEVLESIAVGQNDGDDVQVVLFVVLKSGVDLNDDLIKRIKTTIRQNTTPRHVPARIHKISDVPKTKNGKLAEGAVRKVIHGETIENTESLANPECLREYKQFQQ